jgi:E3 ubiquitin-protein ligase MARCH6
MRPGAMWFIKDPQDPHFQPVKDILERRTISQIQKLGLSALMYGIIITGGFGISSWCLRWISFGGIPVLPLRWYPRYGFFLAPLHR